jgi:hypothetical protein
MDPELLTEIAANMGRKTETVVTACNGTEIMLDPGVCQAPVGGEIKAEDDGDDRWYFAHELDKLTLDPEDDKPVSMKFWGRGEAGSGETRHLRLTPEQFAAIKYIVTGA